MTSGLENTEAIRNASPPVQFGDLGGFSFRMDLETETNAVPEPSSIVLLGGGALSLIGVARRRRQAIRTDLPVRLCVRFCTQSCTGTRSIARRSHSVAWSVRQKSAAAVAAAE